MYRYDYPQVLSFKTVYYAVILVFYVSIVPVLIVTESIIVLAIAYEHSNIKLISFIFNNSKIKVNLGRACSPYNKSLKHGSGLSTFLEILSHYL